MEFNRYTYKAFNGSSHRIIGNLLNSRRPQRILDLGCSEGHIGAALEYHPEYLAGLDLVKPLSLHPRYSYFCISDIERELPVEIAAALFDAIVLADVLEHLRKPEAVLKRLRPLLARGGKLIVSVPNMNLVLIRHILKAGFRPKFAKGPFDRTHLHNFVPGSITKCVENAGYRVTGIEVSAIPIAMMGGIFATALYPLHLAAYTLSKRYPYSLGYQLIVSADGV